MTIDEMYTMMELYGFDDFEDSQKLMLLNEAYFDVVTREPWPFMEKLVTFLMPSGSSQITNNVILTISGDSNSNTVTSKALTNNVATITTGSSHGFSIGDKVVISGVDSTFNGTYIITDVPTSTTFTYAVSGSNVVSVVVSPVGAITKLSALTDVNSVTSFIDTTHNIIMMPERNDTIEKKYQSGNFTNATPSVYYFVGEDLFVYPTVAGDTNYRLSYIRTPSNLTDDTDETDILIPKRHHSIIVYGALVKAFLVNDDPQAAVFQNMFESRYQQMRNDAWMQQYDRTDQIQVMTDSYDWSY